MVLILLIAAIDYYGAQPTYYDGKVIYHNFTPQKQIPVEDPCQDKDQFNDCLYEPGPSKTIYNLIVIRGGEAYSFPVPRSYFYSVSINDRIPMRLDRGLLTGSVYDKMIAYPMKQNLASHAAK